MESLSIVLSSAPPIKTFPNTNKPSLSKPKLRLPNTVFASQSPNSHKIHYPSIAKTQSLHHTLKALSPNLPFTLLNLFTSLPSFATELTKQTEQPSDKINLESVLVSVDDFFNRNPFFVAGCTFIWLVVLPLVQLYLRKYKYIACIDAFRKLRDDPTAQLLDIRDEKSLAYLRSPDLKMLKKSALCVPFVEGDEDGFVKKVMEKFAEPSNTTVCVMDNFDGNSMKVAELLFKSGFKEAYAIKGGARGKKGWQEIQETLLPPSVHIKPNKKIKESRPLETNGAADRKSEENNETSSSMDVKARRSENLNNDHAKSSTESIHRRNSGYRPSSPYPNYPDLKPPTSPTPSKPQR